MDRQTIYYGQLPREVDLLNAEQFAMVGLAQLTAGVFGPVTVVDGFTVVPTSPASLNVNLTAGAIYQVENLEASVWSSLSSDTAHSIVKQGILLDPVTLGITPPGTVGYSQVFLVEVQYEDLDTGSMVLPYYNAANPASPFSGPGNSGSAQNTVRKGAVAYQIKAGIAATTGTQIAPTADAGWTGLYTVTVANGATTITSGNISLLSSAPYIPAKLPQIPAAVQSGKWQYGIDTGSANAMQCYTLNPAPAALVPGMTLRIKKGANANTGATTLDIGLGANAVIRANGSALSSADLPASTVAEFIWDGAYWQYANFQGFNATTVNNNTYTLTIPYAVDSGTANAIVANFSPAVTAVSAGDMFKIKLANNITAPATVTINSLAAINLVRGDGSATSYGAGFAGQVLIVEYDGTKLQVVNGLAASSDIQGESKNKIGVTTSDTVRTWTADRLIVSDGNSKFTKLSSVNVTINSATSGAGGIDTGTVASNTVDYEFVVYNPTTQAVAGLMSLALSPTLPSGYTEYARIGGDAITDSSAKFYRLKRLGDHVEYVITPSTNTTKYPVLASGRQGGDGSGTNAWYFSTSTTWPAVSLAHLVPATATRAKIVLVTIYNSNGSYASDVFLAPNANFGGPWSANCSAFNITSMSSSDVGEGNLMCDMQLESQNAYVIINGNGTNGAALLYGYADPVC